MAKKPAAAPGAPAPGCEAGAVNVDEAIAASRAGLAAAWKKGQSGNPRGRPQGSRNKATILAQSLMAGELEAVTKSVILAAMNGDMVAARLVLERLVPLRKGAPVTFDLPKIETAADVAAATGSVATAVAAGDLSPEEGQAVAGILEVRRKAIETVEHEARIAALEARGANPA